MDNLNAILLQTREARIYFDVISEELKQHEAIIPEKSLVKIGDQLASLEVLFQRIAGYVVSERYGQ